MNPDNPRAKSVPIRAADALAGFDDPSYGDERQRSVILRAQALAFIASTHLSLVLAIGVAIAGEQLISLLVLIAGTAPSFLCLWYAGRGGVDMFALNKAVNPRRALWTNVSIGGLALLWLGATLFHTVTESSVGEALTDGFSLAETGEVWSTLAGAVVGAAAALGIIFLLYKLVAGRWQRQEPDELD